jgi:integrase
MAIFRRYKTFKDLAPGFLMMKESVDQRRTFVGYQGQCRVFEDWLEENHLDNVPLRKLTADNIRDFFYHLGKDVGLDKPTVERYVMDIKQVFKYALKRGEIETIPFEGIILPRKKKDQGAEMIHPSHLKPLLLKIKEEDPQLYLACNIEYYCFIRPGRELRFLKVGDIDLEKGIITVRQENAKNKKKQTVTMPDQLIEICKDFGIDTADKQLYIFGWKGNFAKKPISVNMLRWRFNKFRDSMGLPKGYKFYSFKHTGASLLHMSGISIRELMDHLRHTRLSATEHYLKRHCGIVNERIKLNFPSPI